MSLDPTACSQSSQTTTPADAGMSETDRPRELLMLATDLDGTFLGGTREDRSELYRVIKAHREVVRLVFVTGRDPEFVIGLCADGFVPWPDLLVGDVGTTIATVHPGSKTPIRPIKVLEAEIAERWQDSGAVVRAALEGVQGLSLQPTDFRYRVSYDLDPGCFRPQTVAIIEALGLDVLISDNRFFDVLPKGVSKGPSLRRLVAHLDHPEHRVLAAGDTMNDLSMLTAGFKAVAVGGSEPRLIEAIGQTPMVHKANATGAGGILEALDVFALMPTTKGSLHAI